MSLTAIFPDSPPINWSHSRMACLQRCPREYWHRYIGSWGGWNANAASEVRRAYQLKQIATVATVLGSAVHDAAQTAIVQARAGQGSYPDGSTAEQLREQVRARLNQAHQSSLNQGRWEADPKRNTMLAEVYRFGMLSDVDSIRAKLRLDACITNLLASVSFREAVVAPAVEVRDVDTARLLDFDGIDAWCIPDLMYRRGDGLYIVADWKAAARGKWEPDNPDSHAEGHRRQLEAYALYVVERHGSTAGAAEPEQILGRTEYLIDGAAVEYHFNAADLEATRQRIRDGITTLKRYHGTPVIENFPQREDVGACPSCPFYSMCLPEIQAKAKGPF